MKWQKPSVLKVYLRCSLNFLVWPNVQNDIKGIVHLRKRDAQADFSRRATRKKCLLEIELTTSQTFAELNLRQGKNVARLTSWSKDGLNVWLVKFEKQSVQFWITTQFARITLFLRHFLLLFSQQVEQIEIRTSASLNVPYMLKRSK